MTTESLLPLAVLAGIVAAAVLWQIARRSVQRRLAFRDAVRRPGETMLVITGSLLGTALIAGSFIVGDTLDASIKQSAWTQLGPVDETIVVTDASRTAELERTVAGISDDRIDGVTAMTSVEGAIATADASADRAEPNAQLIEIDFKEAADFGGDPSITGITGPTPADDEVVVTDALADTLEVGTGDRVTAYVYDAELDLVVDRVIAQKGVAGFWPGDESSSPNAFVAPATIAGAAPAQFPEGAVPPAGTVMISNRGDVEEGAALTDEVTGLIEAELGPDSNLRVDPVKQDLLEVAEAQGAEFGNLFLNIGAFAIIAGILLLVNIFVMLAEERKGQLGMLRAVGMRRSDLVRMFIIEGFLYSLVASVIGAVLGIGVGWAIVKLAAPIFSGFGDFSLDLTFSAEISSIAGGFLLGLLISMATIGFTSFRISRFNIIRAIRDLQDPKLGRAKLRTVIMSSGVAALSMVAFAASFGDRDAFLIAILAPPVAAFCLIPILGRIVGRRKTVIAASAFAIFWGVAGNDLTDGQFFESGELIAFVLQGVMLTFSAVVLLSQLQENMEGVLHRLAAERLSLRLSLAYPLARRFRTGLTLGMYSLVIFTMTFIAVLFNVFGGQVDRTTRQEAGGFAIIVDSSPSNPPEPAELSSVEGVDGVAAMRHGTALFTTPNASEPAPWTITGIDRTVGDVGGPKLDEWLPRFEDERDVWHEVASDSTTAIIPVNFLQTGGGPPQTAAELGDEITIIDPVTGAESTRTVIGTNNNDFAFSGVYVSNDSLQDALGGRAPISRFYVAASGSRGELNDLADRLQGRFVANGVDASSFRSLVEDFSSLNLQFMRLMQSYLALGLIVGIAGLGVVMIRAVRDRRREIGVLRALGFVPDRVRSAFLLESGFVALEGILIGSILALVTAAQLVANGDFGEGAEFVIPWGQLAVLGGAALAASLLAAAWPAQKASGIAPAVALRIAD